MGKTIAEHLKEEGRTEGLEKGEVRNQRRMLVRLLQGKFGTIPAAMMMRIEATEQIDLLDKWFDQVAEF